MRFVLLALFATLFLNADTTNNDLGYRNQSLYNENLATPEVKYRDEMAGTSKKIERAFDNAPPMISHSTEGMLPIVKDNNMCLGCHMPSVAKMMGATALPKSHFTNLRTDKYLGDENLYQGRFNCTQCHAPQIKSKAIVNNKFEGGFRDKNGKFSSNLMDSINEGADIK